MKSDNRIQRVTWMSQLAAMSLLVALAVLCGASIAFGQDSGGGGQSEDRYVFDEMQVFGEIDKPEAFYILRASSLDYENIEPVESFLDEMYKSAKESPF